MGILGKSILQVNCFIMQIVKRDFTKFISITEWWYAEVLWSIMCLHIPCADTGYYIGYLWIRFEESDKYKIAMLSLFCICPRFT